MATHVLNNKSMAASIREQITRELGVEPILINSSLVSAQNRQRLYWTNIPGVEQPKDRATNSLRFCLSVFGTSNAPVGAGASADKEFHTATPSGTSFPHASQPLTR